MSPGTPKNVDKGIWDLEDIREDIADSTQWGLIGLNTYKGFPQTQKQLPSGVYSITVDRNDDKAVFMRRRVQTDDILHLQAAITKNVIEEIRKFWGKEAVFQEMGFLHRRGYLFYGPQGTGKSSVVKQIMEDVVKRGGLVFLCDNPKFLNQALITLRQAEPKRHLVCVFEDIDAIISKYGEDDLLSVLDGANMIDRVLNVATTNYPERLDQRIVARPRRFDRVIKIDVPNEAIRREFLLKQLPKVGKKKVEELVSKSEGLSLAALTELIISIYCLGNALDDTVDILRALSKGQPTSSEFEAKNKFGFMSDFGKRDDDDSDNDSEVDELLEMSPTFVK